MGPQNTLFRRANSSFKYEARLEVKKETSSLVFNATGLEVSDVSLYSPDFRMSQADTARSFASRAGRGTLNFPTALPANTTTNLSINFSGKLSGEVTKYRLALAPALDEVRASVAWIERSTTDISEWLQKRSLL